MPIETGSFLGDLDAAWPLSGDFVSEGDDHLRLIKGVLKGQFPGQGGNGFTKAIIATEDEMNALTGVKTTETIQQQIDGIEGNNQLSAPIGTVMIFYNPSPPAGWQTETDVDDSMLRLVNAGGGSTGGIDSPISFNVTHTHTTGDFALDITHIPSHTHRMFFNGSDTGPLGADEWAYVNGSNYNINGRSSGGAPTLGKTSFEGGGTVPSAHNHGDTGQFDLVFQPKYANVIRAIKT